MVATPADVRPGPDPEIRWWRPSMHDVVRAVGWRWWLLAPALLVILAILASGVTGLFGPRFLAFSVPHLALELKVGLFAGGVALSCVLYVIRTAIRARREPFCVFCGYNLSNLPDNYRCPECGRPYTWKLIDEYRRDPDWFIERWKRHPEHHAESAPIDAGPARREQHSRDGTS